MHSSFFEEKRFDFQQQRQNLLLVKQERSSFGRPILRKILKLCSWVCQTQVIGENVEALVDPLLTATVITKLQERTLQIFNSEFEIKFLHWHTYRILHE